MEGAPGRYAGQPRATALGLQVDEVATRYCALADDNTLAPKSREAAMLLQSAEACLGEQGDHEGAMKAATQAAELCRSSGDVNAEADAMRMVIHAYRLHADVVQYAAGSGAENTAADLYDAAGKKAKEYLKRFQGTNDKRGQAKMTLSNAEIADDRRMAYDPDQLSEVLNLASSARNLAKEAGDKKTEGLALILMTITHYRRFAKEEAFKTTDAALANFRAIGDSRNEAKAMHLLGYAHFVRNELEEAITTAQEAQSMFREQRAKFLEAFECFVMAEYYLYFKKGRDALPTAEDGLELYQEIESCKGWQAYALDQVVQAHLLRGDDRRALNVAKEAVGLFSEKNDRRQMAVMWHSVVQVHMTLGEAEEALKAAEEEQLVVQDLGDARWEAGVLLDLATVHFQRGALEKALDCAHEAIEIYQSLKDRQGEAFAMNKLNEVNLAKFDDEAVIQTSVEQRAIFQELDDKSRAASCQLTLAGLTAAAGRGEEAMSMAEEAREWFQDMRDKEGESRALNFMAQFHADQEDHAAAVEKIKEMQECLQEFGHRTLEAHALRVLCEVHLKFGKPGDAVRAACEGLKLVKKDMDKKEIVEYNLLVSRASVALINTDVAGAAGKATLEKALRPVKEALTIAKTLSKGRNALVGQASFQLSQVLMLGVRISEAMAAVRDALAVFRATLDKASEAAAVVHMAEIHFASGTQDKALETANEGLALAKEVSDAALEKRATDLVEKIQGRPRLTFAVGGMAGTAMAVADGAGAGAEAAASLVVAAGPKGLNPEDVNITVFEMAKAAIGMEDDIFVDSPLMDSGMDSLTAVSFRNGLQQQLSVKLPSALMFDYPTIKEVSNRIVELSIENA